VGIGKSSILKSVRMQPNVWPLFPCVSRCRQWHDALISCGFHCRHDHNLSFESVSV